MKFCPRLSVVRMILIRIDWFLRPWSDRFPYKVFRIRTAGRTSRSALLLVGSRFLLTKVYISWRYLISRLAKVFSYGYLNFLQAKFSVSVLSRLNLASIFFPATLSSRRVLPRSKKFFRRLAKYWISRLPGSFSPKFLTSRRICAQHFCFSLSILW